MWIYEKKLEYPAKVGKKNVKLAKYMITQYGGPDGELSAALRYLTQRYTMPTPQSKAICNDIGTEELAHLEIMATLVYKLMEGATVEELKAVDLGGFYADHDKALYYVDATGNPWTASYIQAKGDAVADLHEDMAAEQKARATYEWLINEAHDDPDLVDTLKFLREREVVHFQRFGEALDEVYEQAQRRPLF
ncbi:MAG: manganese catalase family protein [Patescibacteria group bacterium]